MLELWLVRHGETDWNADGRIQGSIDLPLNAAGLRQARRLAARLVGERFDAVYASDLARARMTAETALPGAELRLDPRLRELDYGLLEGKSWERLSPEELAIARHWNEDRLSRAIPGGESYGDLIRRFTAFRAELPERGRIAAFCHGGTVRGALYAALGWPAPGSWRLEIDNTSITRLRYDHRGTTLVVVNDHAHLNGALGAG